MMTSPLDQGDKVKTLLILRVCPNYLPSKSGSLVFLRPERGPGDRRGSCHKLDNTLVLDLWGSRSPVYACLLTPKVC